MFNRTLYQLRKSRNKETRWSTAKISQAQALASVQRLAFSVKASEILFAGEIFALIMVASSVS
jgi:hypothetical protein